MEMARISKSVSIDDKKLRELHRQHPETKKNLSKIMRDLLFLRFPINGESNYWASKKREYNQEYLEIASQVKQLSMRRDELEIMIKNCDVKILEANRIKDRQVE